MVVVAAGRVASSENSLLVFPVVVVAAGPAGGSTEEVTGLQFGEGVNVAACHDVSSMIDPRLLEIAVGEVAVGADAADGNAAGEVGLGLWEAHTCSPEGAAATDYPEAVCSHYSVDSLVCGQTEAVLAYLDDDCAAIHLAGDP